MHNGELLILVIVGAAAFSSVLGYAVGRYHVVAGARETIDTLKRERAWLMEKLRNVDRGPR